MACLFPEAASLGEYWDNICAGRDCLSDVPASRWSPSDYYDPTPGAPDKTYCMRGGFIPDTEFDPIEFGLPPNILEVTDTSQLLSLVVAKRALQDAGYGQRGGREFDRERTGVVLGVGGGQKLIQPLVARLQYPVWERVLRSSGVSAEDTSRIVETVQKAYVPWEENSFPGLLGNVIAGRIANRFDLGGLNCVVDAACASSLAALEMAVGELQEHRVDMVISGGVDTDNSIFMYMCFSKTPAFSHGDHLKPFDVDSDGMMIGEGIGMVVLKRASDAERDGDRIYARIRGIGSSSDGRYKSIYAPRSEGQARALRRAHEAAGLKPGDIDLIEAHGTGTVAGDMVEATTLRQVFSADGSQVPHVAVGSVKSQIGHTKAAAGVAGLIKAALALHHKVLPATINVSQPHPELDLADSPVYLNTTLRPWMQPISGGPRRAGVSSFGFGGSNYHAVLEENESEHRSSYRLQRVASCIVLSAPDVTSLRARCKAAAHAVADGDGALDRLSREGAGEALPAAWPRIGFVARSSSEAKERLHAACDLLSPTTLDDAWESPRGLSFRARGLDLEGRVAVLFPGQGAQHLEMGRELAATMPPVRDMFASMDGLFQRAGDVPLSSVVYPPPAFDGDTRQRQAETLQATALAQPAIGTLSAALFLLLQEAGFSPDFAAGHSFGELTALWAAGAMDLEAFFALARARGRAMAPALDPGFDPGCMIAVRGDAAAIEREVGDFPEVQVANLNAPDQVVLAGPRPAVERAAAALSAHQFAVTMLPVAAAFHTPLVAHAAAPLAEALDGTTLRSPRIPVYANGTGEPYPIAAPEIRATLVAQMSQTVHFQNQIENLYAAGATLFVECGPGNVLTGLVHRILGQRPHIALSLNGGPRRDSDLQFRDALVRLRVAGLLVRTDDIYQRLPDHEPEARRATTILLSGSNYVSEKTRRGFEEALNDGNGVRPGLSPQVDPEPAASIPTVAHQSPAGAFPDPWVGQTEPVQPASHASGPVHLEALEHFTRQQSDAVRAHQQYLTNETEYIKGFQQIMQQQQALLLAPERAALPPGVLESLSQSLSLFHRHQQETTQVHERYLDYQARVAQSLFALLGQHPVPAPDGIEPPALALQSPELPAVVPPISTPIAPTLEPATVDPRPEYTAPPAPVPPAQPVPAPVEPRLTPSSTPAPLPQSVTANPSAPVASQDGPAAAQQQATTLTRDEVSSGLLQIVSEKTGYPVETLELDMDMEADLGIDSIKRVEILGATRERFPDAPTLRPEDLAERRTLAQIVDYVLSQQSEEHSTRENLPSPASAGTTTAPWSPVVVRPLPPPDRLDISLDPAYSCLLTDDGGALTVELAGVLRERGWAVSVMGRSASGLPLPPGVPRMEIADGAEPEIRRLIDSLTAGQGAPGLFINLCPPANVGDEEAMVRQVFTLAKHLQPSITAAARAGYGAFVTVTRIDGLLGTTGAIGSSSSSNTLSGIVSGGLAGLVKTLGAEWPGVLCRAIDLAPEIPAGEAARMIVAELQDSNRLLSEVGCTGLERVTLATGDLPVAATT